MTYDDLRDAVAAFHLSPLGGFQEDGATTILLGPREPGFWTYVSTHPQFQGEDPLDHWSAWAISQLAENLAAEALFPFGGPPFQPFIAWALRSGEVWQSPVGLLVHRDAGLMVSYRGALRFSDAIDLPPPSQSPCDSCNTRPCLTACPVDTLSSGGYDVPKCKSYIRQDPECQAGCRVRLSCPVSQTYRRAPKQTAFHMKAFQSQ